jgi:hypothetical protein
LDRKLAEDDSDYSADSQEAPLHFTLNDPDQIRQYCKPLYFNPSFS